jgi:wyosine [tRNA(Phe)-imidazoG37] synthetase (radical SAM superfamily)
VGVVYGPVPSWRLGRSLGIDLISATGKTCTFDCIYCQLGRTIQFTDHRRVFVETTRLRAELAALPAVELDTVTFSGTGEPTLAANLGEALELIRDWPGLRGIPRAVLTNASLMRRPEVRRDLAHADIVVAKLDAPDEALFRTVNRPVAGCSWAGVVEGIRAFRAEFEGKLALQMMFVAANRHRALDMASLVRSLDADEIELNTPLRPSRTPPLSEGEMSEIETAFRDLPAIGVYGAHPPEVKPLNAAEMARRRPAEGHPVTVGREVS